MKTNLSNGQGLVEVALVLPVLLLIIAGTYVCCRASFLHSAAESTAQAEVLRAGRQLPGVEQKMAEAVLPPGDEVAVRSESKGRSGGIPIPIPSLAGRTKGIVEVREREKGPGRIPDVPSLQVVRSSEATVDCWEKRSGSGKRIRQFVTGFVATGILR